MALLPRSQPPTRVPSGSTTDPPYGPLALSGFGNPFFYHQFADDFDNLLGPAGAYTLGTGTVAHAAGDGGLALFSTTAIANAFESAQLPAADFTLPLSGSNPPATANSSKKLFYLARLQLSDVNLSSFIAGLCTTTAAPFGGAGGTQNVADGLFFYKAPGGTVLQLLNVLSAGNSPSGGAITYTYTIPATAYSLVNATNIDLAWAIDGNQNLFIFVASQLVGWIPQSGTGAVNAAGVPILPSVGPVMANYNYQSQGAQAQTPQMYSLANLNPTLGVCNGATAAIKTMTADFHCLQKER